MSTNDLLEGKSIFLHHVDGYETNEIKKLLMEIQLKDGFGKYKLYGSVKKSDNFGRVMNERHPLEFFSPHFHDYIDKIVNCDILIFNSDATDFEMVCNDLRRVLVALEQWAKNQSKLSESEKSPVPVKYLIFISSPMTWELTVPINDGNNDEEEEEEQGKGKQFLYEEDYRRRKAHKSYCKHKLLERDVVWIQKKCKHLIRSLVVCSGIVYGAENSKLHYIFKLAYYNKTVPIMRPGSQIIPMIYYKDLAQIVVNLIDSFPEPKTRYIFAVQPDMLSLKDFTYEICKRLIGDCSKVRFMREVEMLIMDDELFPQIVLDTLSLDLRMTPTYLQNFPFHEVNDDFWDLLIQEFREERNLNPLKIVVDGPPLVGKTEHARKLASFYQLFYIDIREVIKTYIEHLEEKINDSIIVIETFECPEQIVQEQNEEEEDFRKSVNADLKSKEEEIFHDQTDEEIIDDLKSRIKNWSKVLFSLKVYIASHKKFEDQEFHYVSQCLINLLSTKLCNENQGYIIDGFPFTYDEASQIFYDTRPVDSLVFLSGQGEPDEAIPRGSSLILQLKPTHFISLDATDELLCKRAMSYTETEATIRRCLRHQMLPRLDVYRERNEEPHCLANIFYDHQLIPISLFFEPSSVFIDTLRSIKLEIGSPFIYPLSIAQQAALDKINAEKQAKHEMEEHRRKEELVKSVTIEREQKLLDWTAKYEELRKHESELREVKTLPLRQYLGKYVLPTLTEGILKIAELKPDDPIDFLAEYLFKCNPEGQQVPPFCTEEQRTQFFINSFEDLSGGSEYVIENDKFGCSECPKDPR